MRLEERTRVLKFGNQRTIFTDAVIVSESETESKILDKVFGNKPDSDGFINPSMCECRLADGYGEHYVLIKGIKQS